MRIPASIVEHAQVNLRRRQLVALGLAGASLPLAAHAQRAQTVNWMPYPAHEVTVLQPQVRSMTRIEPVLRDFEPPRQAVIRPRLTNTVRAEGRPPRAYERTGKRFNVAPWLLYGIALQESRMAFGPRVLPYPWTLCVRGTGKRYRDYGQTLAALQDYVDRGVTNVDCGAMQVNWHWHHDKLGSFARALDPYLNLAVGAAIVRGHYEARRSWHKAVALYHTGSDATAATRSRGDRYARQALDRLGSLGVNVAALLAGDGHA